MVLVVPNIHYKKYELKRLILKSLLSNTFILVFNKLYYAKFLRSMPKNSSKSSFKNSCLILGNSKSVFRMFKMCRHQCKFKASNGLLPGMRKASF